MLYHMRYLKKIDKFDQNHLFLGGRWALTTLKAQTKSFLVHVFIKRQQATHFEKMKLISDNESVCIQVDYSENFLIDVQDAV
jgi:hypothetical protein